MEVNVLWLSEHSRASESERNREGEKGRERQSQERGVIWMWYRKGRQRDEGLVIGLVVVGGTAGGGH